MTFQEYPKGLYLRGWEDLDAFVIVQNAAEEAAARAQGYRHINEAVPVAAEAVAEPAGSDDAPDAPKRRGRPPKALEA
jgi:hypothetical protein